MAKAFRAQGKAFVRELGALRSAYPVQEAARWADWADKFDAAAAKTLKLFVGPIDGVTTTAILRGAAAVIADAGMAIAFDLKNTRAEAYLKANPAAAKVAGINDTTRETMRGLIDRAVASGTSYTALAKQITDRFEEFAVGRPQEHIDSRAHLVAVTEVGEAYCEGNLMGARELADAGLEMEKSWSTMGDARVSAGCLANQEAGWIPVEDDFPSGHGRPLRFPGCRCDLLTRMKED